MDRVPLSQLVKVFARIGLLSFGGPVAQIAVMQRELVDTRRWLSEDAFLKALSFTMLLPGPEAMQLCTYAGWRLRGVIGGLAAGLLFIAPGALVMAALAWAYLRWGAQPGLDALFLGVKATVIVVVVQALVRLGRKALRRARHVGLATAAFGAIALAAAPFPLVVLLAAAIGAIGPKGAPPPNPAMPPAPAAGPSLRAALTGLVLWWAPIGALAASGAERLADIGLFFSRLAVVSFGGAYAALAYTAQEAVEREGWLTAAQMVDGLGLAESTPGPLILVTEFVGYIAGHAAGGVWFGLAGAAITLWTIFAPSFLLVFAFAPFIDRLTHAPRLTAALESVTAAMVGVIAALALYFALHVLFTGWAEGARWPDPGSLSPAAMGLTALAALFLGPLRLPLPATLGLTALAGGLAGLV